ncbi:YajG family lipoprotein [Atopomonas sediminilitoris]|uniref:YajG family lipoprotein n=1 Tax=Atopomonas sediminilitoris TaxID=2919919 RepID=UPI001F4DC259|nr:YajG family lipoprotein [Atopomonas sediminilitoris]MCJ8170002.1 YajG family lipoprotein [Atopomonas sediminilitoris]
MKRRIFNALLVMTTLALGGCALSPQQLTLQPELSGSQIAPVGQGQAVVVRVVDGRTSPVIGTRGGVYPDSSTISVAGADILPKLQQQVEVAVRLLGFTPSANAYNAPQLTVTLADIRYVSPKDSSLMVTQADITATLKADVQNAVRRYSGRYSASSNHRFGSAPNLATNNRLVTEVLNASLERMFQDQTIGQILSQ